jgi:peptidoglycan/LPS O-acetylase OafA/YrhL
MHASGIPDLSATSASQRHAFYPLFDYLRILAAVGVFYSHALPEGILPQRFGFACVQLFFAISGFLIGGILLSSNFSAPRFYFNRVTRIWIPYFLAIAFVILGTAAKQNIFDPIIWEFLFYKATFVYNLFGVEQTPEFYSKMPLFGAASYFWSISVEEQFYLVAPILILFLNRGALAVIMLMVIAGNIFYPHEFTSIALGALLAISREHFGQWYSSRLARTSIAAVAIIAFLSIVAGIVPFRIAFPLVAVSLVAVASSGGRQQPAGRLLGGASYSFYLNQWIGLYAIKPLMSALQVGVGMASFLAMTAMLAFSFTHFLVIDTMIQQNRERWFTPRRGKFLSGVGFGLVAVGITVGLCLTAR